MLLKSKLTFLLVCVIMMFISCATTGPGGKKSLILISDTQEIAIGEGMALEVDATEVILDDPDWQAYINEVGQKIVRVCDRRSIPYQFKVIKSDQINAFAAPGGFIYFYTGLLKEMDNEAELAAVMAHEISHVVARHSVKRVQAAMGVSLAYQLVFGEDGTSEAMNTAVSIGMGLTFAGYSRSNEREADQYGINYMIKAGYNPEASITMYEKLMALSGGERSVFEQLVSSHPESQERVANAKEQIVSMRPFSDQLKLNQSRYQQMKARLP